MVISFKCAGRWTRSMYNCVTHGSVCVKTINGFTWMLSRNFSERRKCSFRKLHSTAMQCALDTAVRGLSGARQEGELSCLADTLAGSPYRAMAPSQSTKIRNSYKNPETNSRKKFPPKKIWNLFGKKIGIWKQKLSKRNLDIYIYKHCQRHNGPRVLTPYLE